jgi:hypothetical protein
MLQDGCHQRYFQRVSLLVILDVSYLSGRNLLYDADTHPVVDVLIQIINHKIGFLVFKANIISEGDLYIDGKELS